MVAILSNISIIIVEGRNNCNLKIAVHMSEWSQMIELDIVSNSETPNLATLHRLACAGPNNPINGENSCHLPQFMELEDPVLAKR